MKHTPGPWSLSLTTAEDLPCVEIGSASWCPLGSGSDPKQDDANARLIAAAPDLLRALKAAHAPCKTVEQSIGAWKLAEEAIAKAEEK